jgi:hypothetical protein
LIGKDSPLKLVLRNHLRNGVTQCRPTVCMIPGEAKLTSATRRLSRLLDNPAIRVRAWYEPIARQWLEAQFRNIGEVRLIVDGTKIGFGHPLLIVCLAYRKRSIPIAWTWAKHVRGHSHAGKQLALLAYVRKLLRHFLRLSRLTLAVALLYVWLISVGGRTIRDGLRHLVVRVDRRDLSIFQIGLRSIERRLTNALPFCVPLFTYL